MVRMAKSKVADCKNFFQFYRKLVCWSLRTLLLCSEIGISCFMQSVWMDVWLREWRSALPNADFSTAVSTGIAAAKLCSNDDLHISEDVDGRVSINQPALGCCLQAQSGTGRQGHLRGCQEVRLSQGKLPKCLPPNRLIFYARGFSDIVITNLKYISPTGALEARSGTPILPSVRW